jgi:putative FmdB family regulatory protein
MPLYEYRCEECGTFPIYKSFNEERPEQVPCPQCERPAGRIFSPNVAVHFHAGGFSKPRIDPFRTKTGQRPNYPLMEERAMEQARKDQKAGLREAD